MSIYQNTKTHFHHIVPRRKGGTDDPSNLVELTIYDHAIAHRHLWKMYGEAADRRAYHWLIWVADQGDEHYVEMRQKVSKAGKKRFLDPEERKKLSEANKKTWLDPELRNRQSETTKKQWLDPVARKKTSEALKHACSDPEVREKISEANRKRWSDPEARRRQSEATKRGMAAAKARRAAAPQVS